MLKSLSALAVLYVAVICSPAYADNSGCGPAPVLRTEPNVAESIKGELHGQADLLSKLVGKAELSGQVEAARNTIYQTSEGFLAAQKDAYLAYIFCIIITPDKSMSTADKLKAINEFKRPINARTQGTIRQIDNVFLNKDNPTWNFSAPSGAIIEAVGLNCRAVIRAGGYFYTLDKDGRAPIPSRASENIPVSIHLEGSPASSAGGPDPTECHGKFLVTSAD